jgi:hypothetical protein
VLNPARPTARLLRRQDIILRRMQTVTPPPADADGRGHAIETPNSIETRPGGQNPDDSSEDSDPSTKPRSDQEPPVEVQ